MNESNKLSRMQFLQLLLSVAVFIILGILLRIPFARAVVQKKATLRPSMSKSSNVSLNVLGPVITEVSPQRIIAGIKIAIKGTGLENCDRILIGGSPCRMIRQSENSILAYIPPQSPIGRSFVLARTFDGKLSNIFEIVILKTFVVALLVEQIKDLGKSSSLLVEKLQSHLGPDQVVVKRVFPFFHYSRHDFNARNEVASFTEENARKNIISYSDESKYQPELFARIKELCSHDLIPKADIDLIFLEKGSDVVSIFVNPNCEKIGKLAFLGNQMTSPRKGYAIEEISV